MGELREKKFNKKKKKKAKKADDEGGNQSKKDVDQSTSGSTNTKLSENQSGDHQHKKKKKKRLKNTDCSEAPSTNGVGQSHDNFEASLHVPQPQTSDGSLLRKGIRFESAEDFEAFKSGKKKGKKNKFKPENREEIDSFSQPPPEKRQKFDKDRLKQALTDTSRKPNAGQKAQNQNTEKTGSTEGLKLVDTAKAKLKASRFRYLNELLYTQEGSKSLQMFKDDPEAFFMYHEGYADQVRKWPLNPLDLIVKSIAKRKDSPVVADFGCGEAKLAERLESRCQKIHSFDLVAKNDRVTVCDFSRTPLDNSTVDVAVFCLSLMGSNLRAFLHEANRVLKEGGTLKIAEVESRFSGEVSLDKFVALVEKMGFELKWKDLRNDFFYLMDFKKVGRSKQKKVPEFSLKPCIYKKR